MRSATIFLVCFAVAAIIALIVRAALHHPYAEPPPAAGQAEVR